MERKQVALITGASSGIGKAIYLNLINEGWNVYGTSRKIECGVIKESDNGENALYGCNR